MKPIFAILLFSIFFCQLSAHAQNYQIKAKLTGFNDETKFFLKDLSSDTNIDSALLMNGQFEMKGKTSSVKNLWLYARADKNFYYTNLLIGAEQILVTGDRQDFPRHLSVTGSIHQNVANKLNDQTKTLWTSRDSVVKVLMPLAMGTLQNDSIKAISRPLSKKLQAIDSLIAKITATFIQDNLNSYAAVQELYYARSSYKTEEFKTLFAKVNSPYREGNFGNRIKNFISVGEPLKKGDLFQDFEAATLDNKKYRVSDFKGKYILLDFTETYCGPCILAAENLKKIATQYPSNLQIVTFYAETNKKVMQEGINRDKFTWPTIWDGKGTFSSITMKYGVEGYPTFILIDPNGKIVSKISGFGTDENGKGNIENAINRILSASK